MGCSVTNIQKQFNKLERMFGKEKVLNSPMASIVIEWFQFRVDLVSMNLLNKEKVIYQRKS